MRLPAALRNDAGALIYSAKSFAAAMLAYYIALSIGLERPSWAIITVYIVSQTSVGASLSRSLYRLAGTAVGASATVVIVPAFANTPVLCSVVLTGWIVFCLWLSLLERTPRAYAFVLSGYTASLIGFPAVSDPGGIFNVAIVRVQEIAIGIFCAALIHRYVLPAYEERNYVPDLELVGDIAETLNLLANRIDRKLELSQRASEILVDRQHQRDLLDRRGASLNQFALHPLRIVRAMQDIVNNDVTLTVDMGSFHIWIARYLYSFRARQVMISNGQQTMGVALPWAIGAWLVNPGRKVVSVSGDGGFLQSSMELETAVRLNANVLHIIWVDNAYNMVAIQEEKKYQRLSGVEFGPVDFKAYADAFGAKGFAVESAEALEPTLRAAMDVDGPAVVAIPVDYSDNPLLMGQLHLSQIL